MRKMGHDGDWADTPLIEAKGDHLPMFCSSDVLGLNSLEDDNNEPDIVPERLKHLSLGAVQANENLNLLHPCRS